jgi:hypothetical protein
MGWTVRGSNSGGSEIFHTRSHRPEDPPSSWLRHCATSRKVAGSIPDGIIGIFHWHNPSGRTMALGSSQPLAEMSTRDISVWLSRSVRRADVTTFKCQLSWSLGASQTPGTLMASRPVPFKRSDMIVSLQTCSVPVQCKQQQQHTSSFIILADRLRTIHYTPLRCDGVFPW